MYVLYNVNYSLDFIFSELVLTLSEKFFINNILKYFYNKLILIQQSNNLFNENLFDINEDDYINLIEVHIFNILLIDNNETNG